MIERLMHAWERRLAAVDTNRRVRPFEWGPEFIGLDATSNARERMLQWSRETMAESDRFYDTPSTADYEIERDTLRFPSAVVTPDLANNTAVAHLFRPDPAPRARRRAAIVLPQWNADPQGHVGLCRLLARFGILTARLTLPYHDERRPNELERADFIVSPNVGRTVQANRQAVLDVRRLTDWLVTQGFERVGIVGTSLGSCLAMLSMAHDPRLSVGAFNHISPYFADVVWRGLSTRHVRQGLDGHISLDDLRECWMPISPWPFIERVRGRHVLLVYARYDLTFPVDLSRQFVSEFRRRALDYAEAVLPCGHYTTGRAPFKYLDGFVLTKFLARRL